MFIASFPRPHSVDKSWESGNNAKDTPVQYVPINTAVTSEINTNNCACVLLKVPIGAQVLQQTLLQDLLHSHLHIPHLHSHGWLAARQLHQVLLQTHETLVQCWSHSASVLQRKDEFHRPVGCLWPEIRLDITGCSFQAKFQVGWSPFLFCSRFTLG